MEEVHEKMPKIPDITDELMQIINIGVFCHNEINNLPAFISPPCLDVW